MRISGASSVVGNVKLPGDKSISHRAALIGALANGETVIGNFADSDDCHSTLRCLEALGIGVQRNGGVVMIAGKGKFGFRRPQAPLDCGNSGTTMRLLAGVLAGQPFQTELTGDASLGRRPMERVAEPLRQMGAAIETSEGHAPIRISGHKPLKAIEYEAPVASAQLKSCVLLAGLYAEGRTIVSETTETRDHTERMLAAFGADLREFDAEGATGIAVSGGSELNGQNIQIPADPSGAAFFAVAAACLPGSRITFQKVGTNPSRVAFLDLLSELGVKADHSSPGVSAGEPFADIHISNSKNVLSLPSILVIDGERIAGLIDELPIIAVLGTKVAPGIEVRDASELRVKESDRIAGMVENLRKMGADIEEFPDGFRVKHSRLFGARVDSFGDHRIAMACSVAALFAEGETKIGGAECASVSFPNFYRELESVTVR
ncbi:3-phosphoshikimate 1-carboxyvinyltransferase [Leptolyngbya sp. 7M]|uniref:3-phosphoshikimate 1-carboxyvinyltransferase n=1 Tax=Leptolyngbya sp. 7M TaxID=2812896 RepID=UPI001B8C3DDD|nr:3-phosphoshikimate 1-carboxyvinyltransferase [Leptolyngbya sp. 7M]QYO66520.1 3-phosphoshikimate 1-carboxyvinyltransferase [Leptolyngbya sp. 7M]